MKKGEANPNYEYDAFISCKHSGFDKTICGALRKQLRSYKIKKSGKISRIKRVFLNTEELLPEGSLSGAVRAALDKSRFLIVVCSKDTPSSPRFGREIEYFVSRHSYGNVMALLIDGEPNQSFPVQLKYANTGGVLKDVAPLAADIRAESPAQSKKALKREIPRLLAPMLGMSYDDLKQVQQKMAVQKIIRFASVFTALFLLFGIYTGAQWINISAGNRVIREQNEALTENNRIILEHNNHVLSLQSKSTARESGLRLEYGDRRLALLLARHAMPGSTVNPDRPYTEEAEYALSEALGVYNYPYALFSNDAVFTHDSDVLNHTVSADGELLASVTKSRLTVRKIKEGEKIIDVPAETENYPCLYFSEDGKVLYTNASGGKLSAIDTRTGETIWTSGVSEFAMNKSASVCVGGDINGAYLINTATGESEKTLTYTPCYSAYVSPDGEYACFTKGADGFDGFDIFNLNTGETAVSGKMRVSGALFYGDIAAVREYAESGSYTLYFYNLKTGKLISRFMYNNDCLDAYILDNSNILMVYGDYFELYDFRNNLLVYKSEKIEISGSALYNKLLFLSADGGQIRIYGADDGAPYTDYFTFGADGLSELRQSRLSLTSGVMAGRVNSEVFVYSRFIPPNVDLLDDYISYAEFLDNGRLLYIIKKDDGYYLELIKIKDRGVLSSTRLNGIPFPASYVFDKQTGLFYYIADGTLYVARVTDSVIAVEEIADADGLSRLKITDGVPVLYNSRKAVFFLPEDKLEAESSIRANDVFKKDETVLFVGAYEAEAVKGGKTAIRPSSPVAAVHPVKDEYVYYRDGELIFQSFFNDEIQVSIPFDADEVTSLFWSPDGGILFAATAARRLYAIQGTGTDNIRTDEMSAEFAGLPSEAFYLNNVLVIRDDLGMLTLWNSESLKIIARTQTRVVGYDNERLVLYNGMSAGIVPVYDTDDLLKLADETLSCIFIPESDKAKYFIE